MRDRAREVFAKGREMFPDSAAIWLNSGVFPGQQGDLEGARACLEGALHQVHALASTMGRGRRPAASTMGRTACSHSMAMM